MVCETESMVCVDDSVILRLKGCVVERVSLYSLLRHYVYYKYVYSQVICFCCMLYARVHMCRTARTVYTSIIVEVNSFICIN
jgi:hypothetical protein